MTGRLSTAAEAGRGGPDAVRHAPALRRRLAPDGKALRSIAAIRVDLLGLVGLVLLFVAWQLLTNVIPRFSLPTPLGVADRIWDDFILAQYLSSYGLPKTGLLSLRQTVRPENRVGRRNLGFSDRDWIPSSACTRPPFFSSFQHSATASVGAQRSSLSSLLFGISSPR